MSTEPDQSKKFARLLEDSQSTFAMGYRQGALAERARVVTLCTHACNMFGNSVDDITALANKILQAGDAIPLPSADDEMWTVSRAAATLVRSEPAVEYTEAEHLRLKRQDMLISRQAQTIAALREELNTRVV
jgi:hypothetical protein